MNNSDELLTYLKALADANRLKIVGLLAKQPYTVEQLSAMLSLGASTVSHHLAKLSEAGLVTATAQSYYNFYRLEADKMEQMARRLLSPAEFIAETDDIDASAFDRKVLSNYMLPDGRLKTIPSQQKKLLIILRHLAKEFSPGVRYSEKEVNQILSRFHEDTASLRRELVGFKIMAREGGGGEYWRIDTEESEPA